MIKVKRLELKNFLSHVDTSLDLTSYDGLTLIEGVTSDGHYSSNGAGKSTLLEGIVYALTGDTLRGVSVNDVVNRNYKKNTRVTLELDIGEDNYVVSRYRKDDTHGDSLILMKNGENISKRVNKETQKLLEDTLGISYKVLISTVLLGEGLSSRFTQLSDPEKKSLIESTLNIGYDLSAVRAKANSKLGEAKLSESNISGKISALKEFSNFDVDAAEKEIKESEEIYTSKMELVESKNSEVIATNEKINQVVDKMNLLTSSITKIDYITNNLQILDSQNSQLISELTNAEKCDNPRCTLCHQELKSEESHEAFRASYKERINAVAAQMMDYRSQLDNLPDRSVLCQANEKFSSELTTLRNEVNTLNQDIRKLQEEAYPYKSRVDSLRYQLSQYNEAHTDINTLKSDLEDATSKILRYDYFYKLFSPTGVVVNILSDAIEYINGRLSTYSKVLLERDYHINFLKGKISLVDSKGASYQSLSNGEKRRLDISIQFALHDYVHMYCGMKLDCCFIDEILDTLDDVGITNIFDVLRLKLEYCGLKSIYVITHNNSLKSEFDRVITIKKDIEGNSFLN